MKSGLEIRKIGIKYPVLERVTVRSIEIAVAIAYPQNAELNKEGKTVIVVTHDLEIANKIKRKERF